MRPLTIATTLACVMLVPACQDSTSLVSPDGDAAVRSSSPAEGLNASGAEVIRGAPQFVFYWTSPDQAFTVFAGQTEEQLEAYACEGPFEAATATNQRVFRPDGSIARVFRMRQVPVVVYQGDFFTALGTVCSSSAPYATGTGNLTATDNDFGTSLTRTRSFVDPGNPRLTATVVDANGQNHHVLIIFHALVQKDGSYREVVSRFQMD
ncbi:MAG TPA: hypothetical protein VFI41_13730 [Gemmatimonadales bacterium]|nr:hypothetical protein [Gemmatimonadales bacterium]